MFPPLIIAAIASLAIDNAGAMLDPPVDKAGATSPRVQASSTTSCNLIVEFPGTIVGLNGEAVAYTSANPVIPVSEATKYKLVASYRTGD